MDQDSRIPAYLIVYAFSRPCNLFFSLRCFSAVAVCRANSKGTYATYARLAQRKLTVSSPPGLLCDRSFSNGGSAPDGRGAVHTQAKQSLRLRPSCSAALRETHPEALQQTKPCASMMHRCVTKLLRCLSKEGNE